MTEASARFALPFLQAGQAQKELFHNEALSMLDIVVHPVAQAMAVNVPPSAPVPGQAWIVGAAPSGAWAGHAHSLAGWTSGGWRFAVPVDGMLVWVASDGLWAQRTAGGWVLGTLPAAALKIGGQQVVGPRQPAIAAPAGGTSPDGEARAAISAILGALRAHGLIAT